jgi:hypothetical protein
MHFVTVLAFPQSLEVEKTKSAFCHGGNLEFLFLVYLFKIYLVNSYSQVQEVESNNINNVTHYYNQYWPSALL